MLAVRVLHAEVPPSAAAPPARPTRPGRPDRVEVEPARRPLRAGR